MFKYIYMYIDFRHCNESSLTDTDDMYVLEKVRLYVEMFTRPL